MKKLVFAVFFTALLFLPYKGKQLPEPPEPLRPIATIQARTYFGEVVRNSEEQKNAELACVANTHTGELAEFREAFSGLPEDELALLAEAIVMHDVLIPSVVGYTEEEASFLPQEMVQMATEDVAYVQETYRKSQKENIALILTP